MTTFVGKCLKCKTPARFDAERIERRLGIDRWGAVRRAFTYLAPWGKIETPNNDGSLSVACLCGGRARFAPLHGRVSEQKCGARCMASTGPSCECACGGKNHGRSHCASEGP